MQKAKKTTGFKPMLAASEVVTDYSTLTYPVYATPKLDGIRCCLVDGKVLARSLKPIPNEFISKLLAGPELNGLDGELVIEGKTFHEIQSAVMSEDGLPDFRFKVFDCFRHPESLYLKRVQDASYSFNLCGRVDVLHPEELKTPAEVADYVAWCLSKGYEGAILRNNGAYKFGRATVKEGLMLKVKPFEDTEGVVVGFEEEMENCNEAKTNELGRSKRSSHKANLKPKGTLGVLLVEHPKFGLCRIGSGFTAAQKAEIWANRKRYKGKLAKFKYQAFGTQDKPRIPVFLGFRDVRDT